MRTALDLNNMRPLDPAAALPLYAQLAERLAAHIRGFQDSLAGRLLPSELELTTHFNVSRPTVRQAMSQLVSEGLIERGRGRGTFVAPPHASRDLGGPLEFELQPLGGDVTFRLLRRERLLATPVLRTLFRLRPDEQVERVTRLRLIKGEPYGLEERFLPMAMARRLSDEMLSEEAGVIFMRRILGRSGGTVAFRFRAIPASVTQAKSLGTRRGAPLMSSEHTYFDANQAAVLHGTVLFRGDRYDFGFRAPVRGDPG